MEVDRVYGANGETVLASFLASASKASAHGSQQ
jgi:hypothetical protein